MRRSRDGLRRIEDLDRAAEELKHVWVSQEFAEITVAHPQCRNSQLNRFGLRRSIASIVEKEERLVLAAPDCWSALAEMRQNQWSADTETIIKLAIRRLIETEDPIPIDICV